MEKNMETALLLSDAFLGSIVREPKQEPESGPLCGYPLNPRHKPEIFNLKPQNLNPKP